MTTATVRTALICATALSMLAGCSSHEVTTEEAGSAAPTAPTSAGLTPVPATSDGDEVWHLVLSPPADQADTACRGYLSGLEQRGDLPFEDFDPDDPDPAQLPVVGAWFAEAFPSAEDLLATIRAIEAATPGQGKRLDGLADALQAEADNAHAQADAAAAGDVTSFAATLAQLGPLARTRSDVAMSLGATTCAFG